MRLRVPPVNAVVTSVSGIELDEDGYEIGSVVRFVGSEPAFVTEKLSNEPLQGGGSTLVETHTIAIPSTLNVQPGDTLTYTRNGVGQTRVVDAAEDRADAGFTRVFTRDAG